MDVTGADTVSSGASSAPTPDTAAASSAPPADASASAGGSAPDAAASTETGAQTTSQQLDALYEKFSQPQEEVAPTAPVEADEAAAKPEEQTAEGDKPAADETTDAEADEAEVEDDPLADEPKIPTRDEINEKFARRPKDIRELAADMAERAAGAEAKLSEIGGDEGLEVAKAIIPHIFEAAPTPDNAVGMFGALVDANPGLVMAMSQEFVNKALDDEKTGAEFGNRLLESEFGEGYNAELLGRLADAHRQGLIDLDNVEADMTTPREPTARERELESKLGEAEARVKELSGNKEDATRKEEQRLAQTVRETVSRAVMTKVLPVAEKIGWVESEGNKGPHAGTLARLGQLATAEMNAEIESTPEWDAIQQLVTEGRAFRDGQPTRLMRVKLDAIQRRGEAMFKKTARELRPLISLLAGQNAPKDPPPPPTGRSGDEDEADTATRQQQQPTRETRAKSTEELLEEEYRKYQGHARDAAEPVGTLRR